MNVAFMRFADRVLGTLACHLLTGHRRTLGRLFARCPVDPPRAILVIKLLGLGSVLLSGPTQRALKQAYPGAKLFFLTFAENRWVAEALGLADEVWTISSKGVGSLLRDYRQFRRRCRQERIDFCLDLEFFSRLPVVRGCSLIRHREPLRCLAMLSTTRRPYHCLIQPALITVPSR